MAVHRRAVPWWIDRGPPRLGHVDTESCLSVGPIDSRLLIRARSTRRFLVATVLLGVASAALIVIQAFLIARLIVAGFEDGDSAYDLRGMLVALLFVIVVRAVVVWIGEVVSSAGAARGKSELRMAVLRHVMQLGPTWLAGRDSGELSTLCSTGIDSLDAYYARYLPQVVLALVVPPIVIVAILTQDPLSALLVLLTVPLIPLFMGVVGKFTGRTVERQWDALARLSGHFMDVVSGLPTLKAFGRAKAQSAKLASSGAEYRRTTMKVLRISFLSSLVLELVATLSVAIVAVAIGLRLVYGDLTLVVGLTALLLAPEAYIPWGNSPRTTTRRPRGSGRPTGCSACLTSLYQVMVAGGICLTCRATRSCWTT